MPHLENETHSGVNFFELMYENNDQFWEEHASNMKKSSKFFTPQFRALFNSLTAFEPSKRIKIEEIEKSDWYLQFSYSETDIIDKIKKYVN